MAHGILVSITYLASGGLVLRRVPRVAGALRRVAVQVQRPKDSMADEQRPREEERQ